MKTSTSTRFGLLVLLNLGLIMVCVLPVHAQSTQLSVVDVPVEAGQAIRGSIADRLAGVLPDAGIVVIDQWEEGEGYVRLGGFLRLPGSGEIRIGVYGFGEVLLEDALEEASDRFVGVLADRLQRLSQEEVDVRLVLPARVLIAVPGDLSVFRGQYVRFYRDGSPVGQGRVVGTDSGFVWVEYMGVAADPRFVTSLGADFRASTGYSTESGTAFADITLGLSRGFVPYRPIVAASIDLAGSLDLLTGVELETRIVGVAFRWGLGLGARRESATWEPALRLEGHAAVPVGERHEAQLGLATIFHGGLTPYEVDYRPAVGIRLLF